MDIRSRFSPGTLRVIDAALRAVPEPDQLTGADLLWSLWLDESRAAEMLTRAGVNDALLHQALGTAPDLSTEADSISAAPRFPRTALFLSLVDEAHRQTTHEGASGEILTEHLLRAILSVDTALAKRFAELGVSVESLLAPFSEHEEKAAHTLPTDIRLRQYQPAVTERIVQQRLLDAAFNRCREGLRVLEDHTRFMRDDPLLTRRLKEVRHALTSASRQLGVDEAVAVRDTQGDVGTSIHTTGEFTRGSVVDVLRANARRVEEALRTLEEFGKLIDPRVAGDLGQLRYQVYTIERMLLTSEDRLDRIARCRLYLLISEAQCPGGVGDVVGPAMQGGVDVVQLREKGISDRRLISLARHLREWTTEAGALFIVNDRPDIAALVDADGVHLGQDDLDVAEARRIVGGKSLIGVSTHGIEQARQAVADGADYLGVGPCFPSRTKAFDDFAGMAYVAEVAREIRLPWFAIGGINPDTLPTLIAAGGRRIAVSDTICSADDPADAASELRRLLDAAPLKGDL
jgi:thiamine-phosphate pyrophosphorylase